MTDEASSGAERFRARSEEVAWREIAGEVIILDLRSNRYLSINGTAVPLWTRLANEATLDDLTDILVAEHRLDPERARRDAEAFIGTLRDEGLLA